jgi:hypothetical protein
MGVAVGASGVLVAVGISVGISVGVSVGISVGTSVGVGVLVGAAEIIRGGSSTAETSSRQVKQPLCSW